MCKTKIGIFCALIGLIMGASTNLIKIGEFTGSKSQEIQILSNRTDKLESTLTDMQKTLNNVSNDMTWVKKYLEKSR